MRVNDSCCRNYGICEIDCLNVNLYVNIIKEEWSLINVKAISRK